MNLNILKARELHRLEAIAGLKAATLFVIKLHANGPMHIETVITALRNESVRARGIKQKAKPLYNSRAELQFKRRFK